MALILKLKPVRRDGNPQLAVIRIPLDAEFYDLHGLIDIIDDCVYHDVEITLLTAAHEAFDLIPRDYLAIAVLEG